MKHDELEAVVREWWVKVAQVCHRDAESDRARLLAAYPLLASDSFTYWFVRSKSSSELVHNLKQSNIERK